MARDLALVQARRRVRLTICECGGLVHDHSAEAMAAGGYQHRIPPLVFPETEWLRCRVFRPVQFSVARKEV